MALSALPPPPTAPNTALAVVLHYNNWSQVQSTLNGVSADLPEKCTLLLVDNASTVPRPTNFALPEGVELVVLGENRGYAGGFNWALRRCQKLGLDRLIFLTHEVRPRTGCLQSLLYTLEDDPTIAAVGPLVVSDIDPFVIYSAGVQLSRFSMRPKHIDQGSKTPLNSSSQPRISEVESLDGCALVIRISACSEVAVMDESFFLYFEETDFLSRVHRSGRRVMVQRNAVLQQSSLGAPLYLYARNWLLLIRNSRRNWCLGPAAIALSGLAGRQVIRRDAYGARQILLGLFDGLRPSRQRSAKANISYRSPSSSTVNSARAK